MRLWLPVLFLLFVLLLGAWAPDAGAAAKPGIEHIFVIAYDNTHTEDLAKMPHLQAFVKQSASVNWHTVLVSHTAPDYVSLACGCYPQTHGVIDNSFRAGDGVTSWRSWDSPATDGQPMVLAPGPWQTLNAAGFNVGVIGWGDAVLENEDDYQAALKAHPEQVQGASHSGKDYLGYAVHFKDGSHRYGAPTLPWLNEAVGPFPGWNEQLDTALVLRATLTMHAHGVNATYSYIQAPHEGRDAGGYDDRLRAADAAWADFLAQLKTQGITTQNSLFVLTTDEQDHYNPGGTRASSLPAWLQDNAGANLPAGSFTVMGSGNSEIYLKDHSQRRQLEAALANIEGYKYAVVREAIPMIHAAPPAGPRTPDAILFPQPDRTFANKGIKDWVPVSGYYFNHGGVDPAINNVWFYIAGPGIQPGDAKIWADHADLLPTLAFAVGAPIPKGDGRPLYELFAFSPSEGDLPALGEAYKQLNAPLGSLSLTALQISTDLVKLHAHPNRSQLLAELVSIAQARDALAAEMQVQLYAVDGAGRLAAGLTNQQLEQAQALQNRIKDLQSRTAKALEATPAPAPATQGSLVLWIALAVALVLFAALAVVRRRRLTR